MTVETYAIADLAADLRRVVGEARQERDVLRAVRELANRAAACPEAWVETRHYTVDEEQGFGVHS